MTFLPVVNQPPVPLAYRLTITTTAQPDDYYKIDQRVQAILNLNFPNVELERVDDEPADLAAKCRAFARDFYLHLEALGTDVYEYMVDAFVAVLVEALSD